MTRGAVIIGYGTIGKMHHAVLPKSVPFIAVIDPKAKSLTGLDEKIARFADIQSFFESEPDDNEILFYDICPPTSEHLSVMEEILEKKPDARILVEKPVCMPDQVEKMLGLSRAHPYIVAAENYSSSTLDEQVLQILRRLDIESHPLKIEVEFSKTRVEDVEKGRFLAPSVIGYELTHMLTIVQNIRKIKKLGEPKLHYITDMVKPSGEVVGLQGSCGISFSTEKGDEVFLYSSMDGMLGLPISEFLIDFPTGRPLLEYGNSYKYRIVRITDPISGYQIIGQYEPVRDLLGFERLIPDKTMGRPMARIIVMKNGVQVNAQQFADDTLRTHISRAIDYFENDGQSRNYMQEALETVRFLGGCEKQVNMHSGNSRAESININVCRESDIGIEEIISEFIDFLSVRTGLAYDYFKFSSDRFLSYNITGKTNQAKNTPGFVLHADVSGHHGKKYNIELLIDSSWQDSKQLASTLLQQFAVRLDPKGYYNDDVVLKVSLCQDTLGVMENDLYGRIGQIINDIDEGILSMDNIRNSRKEFYSLALNYVKQYSTNSLLDTTSYVLKILSLYKLSQHWVDFRVRHEIDLDSLPDEKIWNLYGMHIESACYDLEMASVNEIFLLMRDAAKNNITSFEEHKVSLKGRDVHSYDSLIQNLKKFDIEHAEYVRYNAST